MVMLLTHRSDGPECPNTGMPAAWCGHCKARHTRAKQSAAHERDDYVVYTFVASDYGRCAQCGGPYVPGERIGITLKERYLCPACVT